MSAFVHFPSWLRPEIIPGFILHWYGLMYLIAFACAYLLVKHQVKVRKLPISEDDIVSFFFYVILGLLLGARLVSVIVYDPEGVYRESPWLIFWPFSDGDFTGLQGMSYHGGLIGAVVSGLIYCKAKKQSFWLWADLVAAGVPLGYTAGRIGNFINGELWGSVTTASWGMIFPHAETFSTKERWVREVASEIGLPLGSSGRINLPRHPSQLYEAFFEGFFLWVILWFIVRKRKKFEGQMIGSYLLGYGLVRFFIEYFREPDPGMGFPIALAPDKAYPQALFLSPWNFSTGQIFCLLMVAAGIIVLVFCARQERVRRELAAQAGKKPRYRKLKKKHGS